MNDNDFVNLSFVDNNSSSNLNNTNMFDGENNNKGDDKEGKNVYSIIAVICSLFILFIPFTIVFAILAFNKSKECGKGRYGAVFALTISFIEIIGIFVGLFGYKYFVELYYPKMVIHDSIGCYKIKYTCDIDDDGVVSCSIVDNNIDNVESSCAIALDYKEYKTTLDSESGIGENMNADVSIFNYAYGSSEALSYHRFFIKINNKTVGNYSLEQVINKENFSKEVNLENIFNVINVDGVDYILLTIDSSFYPVNGLDVDTTSHGKYYMLYDINGEFVSKVNTLKDDINGSQGPISYIESNILYFVPNNDYLTEHGFDNNIPYFNLMNENGRITYVTSDRTYYD